MSDQVAIWDLLTRREVALTFGGVMLAMFLAALDQTIVSTAMPRIIADLNGFSRYTWVTTAYLITSTMVVPVMGRLSDIYGRKWFFVAGILVFLAGSALAGLSQSMTQLIAFRAVQGLGGGAMMAIAFVSIGDLFPPAERGKYQGFMGSVFALSSIVGPLLGGYVTDTFSWHWIFFINLPLGIPVIGLFIAFFPSTRISRQRQGIDYLGLTMLMFTVVPLLLALSLAGVEYPWGSAQITGLLAAGSVMALAFLLVESRTAEPIIPLGLFRNGVVGVSMVVIFLTGFGMFGGIVFVPLFFQGVLGVSAAGSGSFLTPMMLGAVLGSILSGQALSRLGGHYRIQGLLGLGLTAVGMGLLSRMTAQTSYAQAIFNIILLGSGLGIAMPVYTIAVQNAVEHRFLGVATSTTQFVRSIGGTLGLAVLGSVMASRFSSEFLARVPQPLREALPPDQLAELSQNPQALLNPQVQGSLQAALSQSGEQGAALFQQLLETLRASLASAVGEAFLLGLVAMLLGCLVSAFLKEIPLERSRRRADKGLAKMKV